MNETVKQEATTTETTEKTFTQKEVNAIIDDRLKRERAKYEGFDELKAKAEKFDQMEEASKSELQKAMEKATTLEAQVMALQKEKEVAQIREKVAKETGVPAALLTMDTEEACKAQAQAMTEWAKPGSYPQVKDAGEVTGVKPSSTSAQFEDWFNSAFN